MTGSIRCPQCGGSSYVLETRAAPYGTRRLRRCTASCADSFKTAELVVPSGLRLSETLILIDVAELDALDAVLVRLAAIRKAAI